MTSFAVLALPLTLSPQAGRGNDRAFGWRLFPKSSWDDGASRAALLPARGKKVPDKADEERSPHTMRPSPMMEA